MKDEKAVTNDELHRRFGEDLLIISTARLHSHGLPGVLGKKDSWGLLFVSLQIEPVLVFLHFDQLGWIEKLSNDRRERKDVAVLVKFKDLTLKKVSKPDFFQRIFGSDLGSFSVESTSLALQTYDRDRIDESIVYEGIDLSFEVDSLKKAREIIIPRLSPGLQHSDWV